MPSPREEGTSLGEFSLLGVAYLIHLVPRGSLGGSWADVNYASPLIRIASDLSADVTGETLFHELLHVADQATAGEGEARLAEDDVCRLSRALWSMLSDNPGLIGWCWGADAAQAEVSGSRYTRQTTKSWGNQ